MILVLVVLLLLLFRLRSPVLATPVSISAPLGRLLALHGPFLPFPPGPSGCVMSANLLGGPMTPDVRHGLHFALLGQLFSLLFFLFQFEALGRRFKLLFVHYEKVAGTALGKIWLGQNVLDARDRRHFTFVIDILELVHLVRLVNDPITLLKVDQFVLLGARRQLLAERRRRLFTVVMACLILLLLLLLRSLSHLGLREPLLQLIDGVRRLLVRGVTSHGLRLLLLLMLVLLLAHGLFSLILALVGLLQVLKQIFHEGVQVTVRCAAVIGSTSGLVVLLCCTTANELLLIVLRAAEVASEFIDVLSLLLSDVRRLL